MFKYILFLFVLIPGVAIAASGSIDKISIDRWIFGVIIGIISYFIKSLLNKLDKVIDQQSITNNALTASMEHGKGQDSRLSNCEDEIKLMRARYHDLSNIVHLSVNRKEK